MICWLTSVQSAVLVPVDLATSHTAIKTYLSTLLFLAISFALIAVSTTAYLLFYYSYVPQNGLEGTIYLQYGDGPHPHAITALDTSRLSSQQPYDISLELHLPRTRSNLAAGNFMLDLSLLSRPSSSTGTPVLNGILPNASTTLGHSRRPAILPYQSPLLSVVHDVVALPWHTLGLKDLDTDILSIPMFELFSFARGWRNTPAAIKLELQSDQPLQVYSAKVMFHARFEGLRYILYTHRILSFLVFTTCFYLVSLASTAIAWLAVSSLFGSNTDQVKTEANGKKQIKREDDEEPASNGNIKKEAEYTYSFDDSGLSVSNLSDSATTFPSLGRQMPLRFPVQRPGEGAGSAGPSRTEIKREPGVETAIEATAIEPLAGTTGPEAGDDEGEEEARGRGWADRDSGIGTSMESEGAKDSVLQRRRSRLSGSGREGSRRSEELAED